MAAPFDPLDFGFVKLTLQNGSLCFYEYRCGEFCDGRIDRHRITLYLSQDGEFVTVWHGLFDPFVLDQALRDAVASVEGFDFADAYNTPLFRGYIETEEEARLILKALRFDKFKPSVLRLDEHERLCCDSL